jgi:hypothetical protein
MSLRSSGQRVGGLAAGGDTRVCFDVEVGEPSEVVAELRLAVQQVQAPAGERATLRDQPETCEHLSTSTANQQDGSCLPSVNTNSKHRVRRPTSRHPLGMTSQPWPPHQWSSGCHSSGVEAPPAERKLNFYPSRVMSEMMEKPRNKEVEQGE